jgi:CRISPR-associated endonuclease Csn1
MPKTILGLDMGSNSVGSAWIDMNKGEIHFGISHFPAGVKESDVGRGAPKSQERRQSRLQRRTIERRAERKRHLREVLTDAGLLPKSVDDVREFLIGSSEYAPSDLARVKDWWQAFFNVNPWHLRRRGLTEELSCYEFGRLLVHLNQRRGALGIEHLPDEKEKKDDDEKTRDDKKAKRALNHTTREMGKRGSRTFGEFMANLMDERRFTNDNGKETFHHGAIRNRGKILLENADEAFIADRPLIRREFHKLWNKQQSFDGDLAAVLTNNKLLRMLDDPKRELYENDVKQIWRDGGAIFGQRETYWKVETLGRCDLEPTDRCCPHADMYAQQFRLQDFVNNLRFREGGRLSKNVRPLNAEQRDKVLALLTIPQMTVRKGQETVKKLFSVNDVKKPSALIISRSRRTIWLRAITI